MDTQSAQELADRIAATPTQTWLVVAWAIAFIIGLALWALGGRLARPSCTFSGVVLGGAAGYMAGELFQMGDWIIAFVVAGALVGGVIAWSLFRVWMGISLAALLGLVVPLAAIAWDGRTVTDVTGPVEPPPAPSAVEAQSLTDSVDLEDVTAKARAIGETYIHQLVELARTVWRDLDSGDQTSIATGAGMGALAGLLFGLLLPYAAAAVEAAIVGASIMLVSGVNLLMGYAPQQAQWLSASPRRWFIALGLITILGVMLQWTVLRKRADRK